MSWLIRWDDVEMSSDDMLIEDLENVEKSTGSPWSVANPLRDIKVARAFLAVAMLRSGKTEEQVADALGKITLATLKTAFDWKPDDEATTEGSAPLDRPARTSRRSSPGRPLKGGSRPIPDDNA